MPILEHLRRKPQLPKRGFAGMSAERARTIQSQGGKASPTRFNRTDGRAATAGRKGGKISKRSK